MFQTLPSSYDVLRKAWQSLHVLSVSLERCLLLLESVAFTTAGAYRIPVIFAGYGGHSLCVFPVGLGML